MEISKHLDGTQLTLAITGCLDTTTSPALQRELDDSLADITSLKLDFSKLSYVSSAGLRVLLVANKSMLAKGGKMVLFGVSPSVREVFEMTGFLNLFTIEE